MNIAATLARSLTKYKSAKTLEFEGVMYPYEELGRQIRAHASVLRSLGVKAGDRVALSLPKGMDFIFLHLAVMSLDGVTLPLNPAYQPEEIVYFLTDSGAAFFFTDCEGYDRAEDMLGSVHGLTTVLVDAEPSRGALTLAHARERADPDFTPPCSAHRDDVAVICYTSGTTGRSKGAMITHGNLVSNMLALKQVWELNDGDVLLHVLPLFHVHGLFVALHGALNAGARIVMHERFDPVRAWETIEKERCTVLMGVPTIYQRLMNVWDGLDNKPDLSSVRVMISGSSPLSEHQFHRFGQLTGLRLLERYGMTETGMIASNTLDPRGRVPGSVGHPLPGVEIRIAGPDGTDVEPGEVGEVLVRGDNVFPGYWQMPAKTEQSFIHGWLKTGDLGRQDPEDGDRLYLVGRAKELIISGGLNVYPKEVENVLESHKTVSEAAVIGLPDDDLGERVIAVVVPSQYPGASTEADLIRHCRQHLAAYKCPKEISFVRELPRNAMGKLQKNKITEDLQQQSAK